MSRQCASRSELENSELENPERWMMVATLATVNREPGQDLTGAAISGVALCEGCRHHPAFFYARSVPPRPLVSLAN